MLKPQDIVILLKIFSTTVLANKEQFLDYISQNKLATLLCMSVSEVNAGIKRLIASGLLSPVLDKSDNKKIAYLPYRPACEECLISGVKYFLPVKLGSYTRGVATSYAAPLIEKHFILGDDPVPVWPYAEGDRRGLALEPLYRSVPKSITEFPDPVFYDLLVLVDVMRCGRAREKSLAIKLLKDKLRGKSTT